MLDSIEPQQFNEWLASEELDPLPDPEALLATLRLGFAGVCRALGMDVEHDAFDPRENGNENNRSTAGTPEKAAAMLRAISGGNQR